jgi:rare lipoprotein A
MKRIEPERGRVGVARSRSLVGRALTALTALTAVMALVACAPLAARPADSADPSGSGDRRDPDVVVVDVLEGRASYYSDALAGRRTASGVPYRPEALVAAHRSLPFGTRLRVENLGNGRVVEVTVVDRGPFTRGRVLDLSRRAAEELGFVRQGVARVRIEVLAPTGAAVN